MDKFQTDFDRQFPNTVLLQNWKDMLATLLMF